MIAANPSMPSRRTWLTPAIVVLLVPQLVGILWLFPKYAFQEGSLDLQILAVGVALLALVALSGLWLEKSWASWAALVLVSFVATYNLFALSLNSYLVHVAIGLALLFAATMLLFLKEDEPSSRVSAGQRLLFGSVFVFAGWVAVWGLFYPRLIGTALPLSVPPLHARFLGAMYLSGATFMLLAALAREWSEVRVATIILAVWTGTLGVISLFYLEAFSWSHGPTWFWFFAYICFPLVALWIAWIQRERTDPSDGPEMSGALRSWLNVQGTAAVVLGLCLLIAPQFMTRMWPWAITVMLAHIYGAPFLGFGLGNIYAARQRTWREARIAVLGTIVFAATVLVASWMHAGLFRFDTPSAWIWFGGFAAIVAVSLLLAGLSALHAALGVRGTALHKNESDPDQRKAI